MQVVFGERRRRALEEGSCYVHTLSGNYSRGVEYDGDAYAAIILEKIS